MSPLVWIVIAIVVIAAIIVTIVLMTKKKKTNPSTTGNPLTSLTTAGPTAGPILTTFPMYYWNTGSSNTYNNMQWNTSRILTSYNDTLSNISELDISFIMASNKLFFVQNSVVMYPSTPIIGQYITFTNAYAGWWFSLSKDDPAVDSKILRQLKLDISNGTNTFHTTISSSNLFLIAIAITSSSSMVFAKKANPVLDVNSDWYVAADFGL